jgi:hypothetical protein
MIAHIILAILILVPIAVLARSWVAGAAAASAWSLSREITQAEYRWIEHYGSGLRANMPWWGGLDPGVWQKVDPWLDWVVPVVVTVLIAMLARSRSGDARSAQRPQQSG